MTNAERGRGRETGPVCIQMGLIVDNFAGGGGASTGIEMAMGRPVDIAINHDPAAIAMHKINHPNTKHYCEDVWTVDPLEATKGQPVDLAWFSPDCKHFSKAKGSKPVDKNIRGLAWVAVKWAKLVRPAVIILENVEEFKTWGPIIDGQPDPAKRGETFGQFTRALQRFGYQVEYRELKACDYGAPTSRKRFFLIARCDGLPIVWPEPTHGEPDRLEVRAGMMQPWHTAAEIIDWSIPDKSIFNRRKSLCEATIIRIARGLEKFVINDPKPFIINYKFDNAPESVQKPLSTITSVNSHYVVTPYLAQYHSYDDSARGLSLDRPLLTLDASNRYALITPYMMHYYGTSIGASVKSPVGTITANGQHIAKVQAFLIKYYGTGDGQRLTEPLATIVSKDRFGLVMLYGEPYQLIDIGMRMLSPRELFDAQGFPADYIIDHDAAGNPYPKSQQVAKVGNSVVPLLACALVRSNVTENKNSIAM